jgi:hypothetical protein
VQGKLGISGAKLAARRPLFHRGGLHFYAAGAPWVDISFSDGKIDIRSNR